MIRPLPVVVGVLAALVMGTGAAMTVVRSGDESASPGPTTAVESTTTVVRPAPTTAPTTTLARATTTRVTSPTPAPTTARPVVTVAPSTTTRAQLTRAAATRGLCSDIEASVRLVVDGNTIGGGLRLVRAVNTYETAADPAVVAPARRMLSAGLNGDLDASAAATLEAAAACRRAGFPVNLPGGVQCVQAPCP